MSEVRDQRVREQGSHEAAVLTPLRAAALFDLRFSSDDMNRANEEWGCNCGPTALAAALRIMLEEARDLIPWFVERKYTSPSMMTAALNASGVKWNELTKRRHIPPSSCPECLPDHGLVRVQWTGPWTQPGANGRWAYGFTHWFATFTLEPRCPQHLVVFDCNSGPVTWQQWRDSVPHAITSQINRADGGWYLTHLIQVGS